MVMSKMRTNQPRQRGFTLPSVLIVSLVMFGVLVAALQLSAATARSLEERYYQQLARESAEAGNAFIASCIPGLVPTNTTGVVLGPGTNCSGSDIAGQSKYIINNAGTMRTRFESEYLASPNANFTNTRATGIVELLRSSSGTPYKTYTHALKQQVARELDADKARPTKRWWHFGAHAAIDFGVRGSNTRDTISTPASGESAEGMTTVADRDGELLFYSDGLTVWDRNYQYMPVASGQPNSAINCDFSGFPFGAGDQRLCGSRTGTQAVASFPINREETKFIIVTNTVNAKEYATGGGNNKGTLYMSMIDFSNPSYPNGRITFRNQPVRGSTLAYAGEGLNARPNLNGDGAIVYTYDPTGLAYGFLISSTNNGLSVNVTQTITAPINNKASICNGGVPFGSINFDKSYKRMAIMMGGGGCLDAANPTDYRNAGRVLLLNIGPNDNQMTAAVNFKVGGQAGRKPGYGYSADFSESGNYLYVTKIYPGELYRYQVSNIGSPNFAGYSFTENSELFVGYTGCQNPNTSPTHSVFGCYGNYRYAAYSYQYNGSMIDGGGQVLRGPDDRMYVANRGAAHISVVDTPESTTATPAGVGWKYSDVRLPGGSYSMYGLPQMVTMYSPTILQY